MGYLVMGGIAFIAIAFIFFVTIRFQTMEAVYYRDYGKPVKGRITEVNTDSAEHHAAQKNQVYDIKVAFEYEGKEYEGEGTITSDEYLKMTGMDPVPADQEEKAGDNKQTEAEKALDKEVEFYCDSMAPGKVIFYDPSEMAAKGQRNNKIALALLFAGLALFLAGRIMM